MDAADMGIQRYNFSFVGFVDCRLHKLTPAGYTRKGEKGIEGISLPIALGSYCDTLFSAKNLVFDKSDTAFVFMPVINQITIQEIHDAKYEYSIVSLAVDYYEVYRDSCRLFYRSYVRINDKTMFSVEKLHSRSLALAFSESFGKLKRFIEQGILPFEENGVLITSIREKQKENWKTFKLAKKLKDGIYFSSRQLLQNEPSLNYPKLISKVDTSFNAVSYNKKNNFFEVNSFYALVKDHELYIQLEDRLYHKCVLEYGSNLVYYKNLTSKEAGIADRGPTRVLFLGGQFGLLGAVATLAVNAAITKITPPNSSADILYIDLESGLIDIQP
jgi:hypothetical protein